MAFIFKEMLYYGIKFYAMINCRNGLNRFSLFKVTCYFYLEESIKNDSADSSGFVTDVFLRDTLLQRK